MAEGWPDLFGIVLGTLDREVLENDSMKPDVHLFWSCGIDWVKDWTAGGLPKVQTFEVDQLCN